MTNQKLGILLVAGASIALAGCMKNPTENVANQAASENKTSGATSNDPVKSAESAAPASIAHDASVVTVDASGAMKSLREGKNGWTCMPDSPATPGPDPMCMDANAGKWAQAWIGHKPPPANTVGVIYMLEGGTDASNTDPYAPNPTSDNDWIKTGPHVMIVGSKEILAGMPQGAKPDTAAPYVMWGGTPYAHLMVPTSGQ